MIFKQLTDGISDVNDARKQAWIARWAGLTADQVDVWEPEPDYGAFVDGEGKIVNGSTPPGAFLSDADVKSLELAPKGRRLVEQHPEAQVCFVDWGRQTTAWPRLFEIAEEWERQNLILDCGPVQVDFPLWQTWKIPTFLIFREKVDTEEVSWTVISATGRPLVHSSLLARAQAIRDAAGFVTEEATLPMLPFTLENLRDSRHAWPTGIDGILDKNQAKR